MWNLYIGEKTCCALEEGFNQIFQVVRTRWVRAKYLHPKMTVDFRIRHEKSAFILGRKTCLYNFTGEIKEAWLVVLLVQALNLF